MGVSIVIPLYNEEKYLKESVKSVISQSFTDIEIILVNDGSTDGSLKICCELSETDSRIKVIDQKNQGLVMATCSGVASATQEYLMFMDANDWYEEDMVKDMHALMVEHEADCVNGTYKKYISDSQYSIPVMIEERMYNREEIEELILKPFFEKDANLYRRWSVPRWDKIYRTELAKKVCGQRNKKLVMGEDLDFTLRYLSCSEKIMAVNSSHYCYRAMDESMSHSYTEKMLDGYKKLFSAVRILAAEQGRPYQARAIFEDNGYMNLLFELSHSSMDEKKKKEIRHMLIGEMHSPASLWKMAIKEDFPGRDQLQLIYRKVRTILHL